LWIKRVSLHSICKDKIIHPIPKFSNFTLSKYVGSESEPVLTICGLEVTNEWAFLRYIHDKKVWEQEIDDREASLRDAAARYEALVRDLNATQTATEELRRRLTNGIEENENLYQRVHELEGRNAALALSVSRERGRSVESLSELTNVDLDINFDEFDKDRFVLHVRLQYSGKNGDRGSFRLKFHLIGHDLAVTNQF